MSEWRDVVLGDLVEVKHGFAFKGEYFTNQGDYILLTPGNFLARGGLKLSPADVRFYSGSIPPGFVLSRGDLLVVMTDLKQDAPILGAPAFVPDGAPLLHNQRLGLIKFLDPEVDARFIYHFMCSTRYRHAVKASATGSTVRHTAPDRIRAIKLRLPHPKAQHRIGDVLSTFDDVIANNQRRIELLEKTAQSLYREWFVRLRFPSHESPGVINSPLDLVLNEWAMRPLGECLDFVMGQSPKSVHYNDGSFGLPFHQGVGSYGRRYPQHRRWTERWTKEAFEGDTLISVRAPVGRLNVADRRLALGRGLAAVRPRDDLKSYWFEALRHLFRDEDAFGCGTIFKAVTRSDLDRIDHVLPPIELRCAFDRLVGELAALDRHLDEQLRTVVSARDLLLPKLVTGQIEVDSLGVDDVFGWAELAEESAS